MVEEYGMRSGYRECLAAKGDHSLVGCDTWSVAWSSGPVKQIPGPALSDVRDWSSEDACDPPRADPRLQLLP